MIDILNGHISSLCISGPHSSLSTRREIISAKYVNQFHNILSRDIISTFVSVGLTVSQQKDMISGYCVSRPYSVFSREILSQRCLSGGLTVSSVERYYHSPVCQVALQCPQERGIISAQYVSGPPSILSSSSDIISAQCVSWSYSVLRREVLSPPNMSVGLPVSLVALEILSQPSVSVGLAVCSPMCYWVSQYVRQNNISPSVSVSLSAEIYYPSTVLRLYGFLPEYPLCLVKPGPNSHMIQLKSGMVIKDNIDCEGVFSCGCDFHRVCCDQC